MDRRSTFFDMLCFLAVQSRRALIAVALLVAPAWLGGGLLIMVATWIIHGLWPQVEALGYGASVAAAIALWALRWAARWVKFVTPPGRRPEIVMVPHASGTGYTGWNQPLRVTLTATANPYLQARLPLTGLVRVHEMRTDDYAHTTSVSFQETTAGGTLLGPPVMVDDARFTYEPPAGTA